MNSLEVAYKKRKRVVLTIKDKIDICNRLDCGEKRKKLANDYGIGTSTICDIRKQRDELMKFYMNTESANAIHQRRALRKPKLEQLDLMLYDWYVLKRSEGAVVTGTLLIDKAKSLYAEMQFTEECAFSEGWLNGFKSRHGIKLDLFREKKLHHVEGQVNIHRIKNEPVQSTSFAESTESPKLHSEHDLPISILCSPDISSNSSLSVICGDSNQLSLESRNASQSQSISYEPQLTARDNSKMQCLVDKPSRTGDEESNISNHLKATPKNLEEILLHLKAEKFLLEIKKLKCNRHKIEAEKRNIKLRMEILFHQKQLDSLDNDIQSEGMTELSRLNFSQDKSLKTHQSLLSVPSQHNTFQDSVIIAQINEQPLCISPASQAPLHMSNNCDISKIEDSSASEFLVSPDLSDDKALDVLLPVKNNDPDLSTSLINNKIPSLHSDKVTHNVEEKKIVGIQVTEKCAQNLIDKESVTADTWNETTQMCVSEGRRNCERVNGTDIGKKCASWNFLDGKSGSNICESLIVEKNDSEIREVQRIKLSEEIRTTNQR